jgi:hypothetical protein
VDARRQGCREGLGLEAFFVPAVSGVGLLAFSV